MDTSGSWFCLWRLITFPLAGKFKAFLADPPAFVAAAPWRLLPPLPLHLSAAAPATVEAKEGSEEWDEDMRFGLSLITKNTNSASFICETRK